MDRKLPINELRKLVYGSRNICLARTPTDVFAFDNSCPHMGETLHKGKIKVTQAGLRSLMTKLKDVKREVLQCD